MMKSSFDINFEKQRQNTILYEKVKSKNREIAKNLILDYDLTNSILKIIKNNTESYEKMKSALEEHFSKREAYVKELCRSL
jgi:hypothetical protein